METRSLIKYLLVAVKHFVSKSSMYYFESVLLAFLLVAYQQASTFREPAECSFYYSSARRIFPFALS
jgi:hypothetical protein